MHNITQTVQKGRNPYTLIVKEHIAASQGQITLDEVEQWCRKYRIHLHVREYNDVPAKIHITTDLTSTTLLNVAVTGDPMPIDKLNLDNYVPGCSIVTSVLE